MGTICFQFTFFFFFFSISIFTQIPTSYSEENEAYKECSRLFNCGNLKGLSYPFWTTNSRSQYCGQERFKLNCLQPQHPLITIGTLDFLVLDVNQSSNLMTIARLDFWNNTCPPNFTPTTLNDASFGYYDRSSFQNISFYYNCEGNMTSLASKFSCPAGIAFYTTDLFLRGRNMNVSQCEFEVEVPVPVAALEEVNVMDGMEELKRVIREGFKVSYKSEELCKQCVDSGGVCGSNTTTSSFTCHCGSGHPSPYTCYQDNGRDSSESVNVKWKVVIGMASGGIAMLIVCTGFRYLSRNKQSLIGVSIGLCKDIYLERNNRDIEAFVKNYGPLAPTRYNFSDVKKMTNSFKLKLGQGGYGDVYKGKLLDGHLVAVKLLNASKGSGDDFINEVASISRTSHVNIVNLLGFCLEGNKRALVYEFMANGSLEKFTFNKSKSKNDNVPHLGWEKLYQIAIGVARGLEYLHRGCNTRIVHFDIKPNNVLLDEDFCPKISDFGLAKLCTRKESVVSMLHARGTIGYIAPEVFSRSFGEVSHKSDVYSYGMMVLEMVGEREGESDEGEETTMSNFPEWVYKHLEVDDSLELEATEENEIVKKMRLVGLWCIQTNPSQRPSMSKVIEMLEGRAEGIKIPPKPFLFSPQRSPPSYSSSSNVNDMVLSL